MNTSFVLVFGLSIQKNVNIFLRKAGLKGATSLLYVCFPPKFFFWECCRTTLFYECVRCKLPFRSLENKIYLMGLYTSSDLFFLWNAIYLQGAMTSMQSELIITICSHRVVPLRCKRVTQWERIQYHVVNAAFWDWCSGANSQGVAITWGNQITPQTRHFWKPLNSPSFTWACRDPSAQRGSLHELFVVGTSQSAGVSEAVTTHTVGRPEPHLAEDWAVERCCSVLLLNWKTHVLCGVLKTTFMWVPVTPDCPRLGSGIR